MTFIFVQASAFFSLVISAFFVVILVALGMVLSIILTVVAFTIWKFFRQRFYQDKEPDIGNLKQRHSRNRRQKLWFKMSALRFFTKFHWPQMDSSNEKVRICSETTSKRCCGKFWKTERRAPAMLSLLISCRSTSCSFTKERNQYATDSPFCYTETSFGTTQTYFSLSIFLQSFMSFIQSVIHVCLKIFFRDLL